MAFPLNDEKKVGFTMEPYAALTRELRRLAPGLELRPEEPMGGHTTLRVGGPVKLMAFPASEEEAIAAVKAAAACHIEPLFLGNGSNLLVADAGVTAFVICGLAGLNEMTRVGETGVKAGSGVLLAQLARFAWSCGLTGLEFAHGIPGTLGGAITMNAGAYGGEMKNVVLETEYLTPQGERRTARGEAHEFAYRKSAFSDGTRLILSATLALSQGDPAAIRARMEELMARRKEKQPLEFPSAGSTFKRPEGQFAAALIDACGLKGHTIGGAQVSEKHAGFLINRGGATCDDMLRLIDYVEETVFRETGTRLELEIKTLGRG